MIFIKHSIGSPLKGTERTEHKYIERFGEPGNYRYVYAEDKINDGESVSLSNRGQRIEFSSNESDQYSRIKFTSSELVEVNDGPFAFTSKGTKRYKNGNCGACTIATELRNRGYNVQAKTLSNGITNDVINNIFTRNDGNPVLSKAYGKPDLWPLDSKNTISKEGIRTVRDSIFKNPEGSRGAISFDYFAGAGHILNWERVGDKIVFNDGQNGKQFILTKDMDALPSDFSLNYARTVYIARLDDCDINLNTYKTGLFGLEKDNISQYIESAKTGTSYNKSREKKHQQKMHEARKKELKRKHRTN